MNCCLRARRYLFHSVVLMGKVVTLRTALVLTAAVAVTFAVTGSARRGSAATSARPAATQSRSLGRTSAGSGKVRVDPVTAVSAALGLRPGVVSPSAAGIPLAQAVLPTLTPLQLAGQRVIYSYGGLNPPAGLLSLIRQGEVAGIIFFSENVGTEAHLAAVVRELQAAAASPLNPVHLPLLLMTDQEGGEVRRLPGRPFLSAKAVGLSGNPPAAATSAGQGAALNLLGVGLNVNLAPVLDVFRTPGNFIDQFGRSFSNNAATVATLGTLYATAEQNLGVAATVKHFPGLGAATTTQNTDLRPVTLPLSLSTIRNVDELPYESAIAAGVKLVLVSWAIYPALDPVNPAGLSSKIIFGELRERLGFGGVTITDALEAGALASVGSTQLKVTRAARAGMDLMLASSRNFRQGLTATTQLAFDFVNHLLNQADFEAAAERVIALRATLATSGWPGNG
jgi:beta-N-acetylhexosaminidase